MDEEEKIIIKFKAVFSRQFFPKNYERYEDGDFAILAFSNIVPIEGEVKKYIHKSFGTISVVGNFPYIKNNKTVYTITCEVSNDGQRGEQNKLLMIHQDIDLTNISAQKTFFKAFLSSSQINNLYSVFDDPLKIIANEDIDALCEAKGIGIKTAETIIQKYNEHKEYGEAYVQLANYGISSKSIIKLSKQYGSPSILVNKIKTNPYILTEVKGVGFKKADKMALNSGMSPQSPFRLQSFIKHILEEGAQDGYSWISSQVLVNKVEEEIGTFSIEDIALTVEKMKKNKILLDGTVGIIALQKYYNLECKIKDELLRIKNGHSNNDLSDWEDRVKQAEKLQGWEYTDEQIKAIKMVTVEQVCVIGGKAGTGKTSTALGAIKALNTTSFGQCCLSGKASARLKEVTGYDSFTVHRLLGCGGQSDDESDDENNSKFLHNKKMPLDLDVVLLDEFAMLGGYLFLSLLEAIPTGCKLIMLGDPAQLPAIGCLNIGSDLINAKSIPTVLLSKIHRQAQKSSIITDSIKISESEQITEKGFTGKEVRGELKDLELDIFNDNNITLSKVIEHFKEKMSWCNDVDEVQVIAPTRNSVYTINNALQEIYNPFSEGKKDVILKIENNKEYTLRVGDKIINMINNYKTKEVKQESDGYWSLIDEDTNNLFVEVFNGYIGKIVDIQDNSLIINFPLADNKTVIIEPSHWRTSKGIHLGYALTTHKCQGSSFKYPICVFDYTHYIMLSREAIYTAMTRASLYCTVIAENKALRYGITRTAVQEKQTFLKGLLDNNKTINNLN